MNHRELLTTKQALAHGLTSSKLHRAKTRFEIQHACYGVYFDNSRQLSRLETAIGLVISSNAIAIGSLAGALYGLDSIVLKPPYGAVPWPRRSRRPEIQSLRQLGEPIFVNSIPCTNGLQTLIHLAARLNTIAWEQVMESALRSRICTIEDIAEYAYSHRSKSAKTMQRVLALRPHKAPATESLLETLMVQLIRTSPLLPEPVRQFEVRPFDRTFVARVDLCWPDVGVFVELDGQHHKDQPEYDSSRETAIIAATGWYPARFTWREVRDAPKPTLRRLTEIFARASSRPAQDRY